MAATMMNGYGKQDSRNRTVTISTGGNSMREYVLCGKQMNSKADAGAAMPAVRIWLVSTLICLMMFGLSYRAFAAGGDIVTPFPVRDQYEGKQLATASVVDSEGNVIITGSETPPGSGSEQFYTVKVSRNGLILWRAVRPVPGFSARAVSVAVDQAGNVFVTGNVNGANANVLTVKYAASPVIVDGFIQESWSMTFDGGGNDTSTAISVSAANGFVFVAGSSRYLGNESFMVVKYQDNGSSAELRWYVPSPDTSASVGKAKAISADGSTVAVTGQSWSGSNLFYKTIVYDHDGQLQWERQYAMPGAPEGHVYNDSGMFVKHDSKGHVVVTGEVSNGSNSDIYTVKYCSSAVDPCLNKLPGDILWEQTYDGGSLDEPNGLFIDRQTTNLQPGNQPVLDDVYVTGHVMSGTARFHIYTVRYNAAPAVPQTVWHAMYNSGNDNTDIPASIVADTAGSLYVTGYSEISGNADFRTLKYRKDCAGGNNSCTELWSRSFKGAADKSDRAIFAGMDPLSGQLYVAGNADETTPLYDISSATSGSTAAVVEDTLKAWGQNALIGYSVMMTSGSNKGQSRVIESNSATTLTLATPFVAPVSVGDGYYIIPRVTTASGSETLGADTIIDANGNWNDDLAGYYVMMTSGRNKDQFRPIQSNTATSLSLSFRFAYSVNVGDTYYIFDRDDLDYYVVKYDQGILNAPTNLAAVPVTGGNISLSWQDNSPERSPQFIIERCKEGSLRADVVPCDFVDPLKVVTIPHDPATDGATTKIDSDRNPLTGLKPDMYYFYRVRAFTPADGTTLPSNTAHAITQYVNSVTPTTTFSYAGVANNDDYTFSIAVGPDRHPVLTGKSYFDPGGFDYYTVKLDRSDLTKIWSQRYDDPEGQSDIAMCLAVDNNNQIIVSGYANLHNMAAGQGINSIFTIKYLSNAAPEPEFDPLLIEQWSHQYNGPGLIDDRPTSVATTTDGSNNIAVAGYGIHAGTDMANHDIYILRYPAAGPTAPGYWAAPAIDKGLDDEPTGVVFDTDGNIIVTGFTQKISGAQDYDFYTAKLCGSTTSSCPVGKNPGDIIWEQTYDGGFGNDMANGLVVDSSGAVYVTGFTTNEQGNWDYLTLKYGGSDGALLWHKQYDGPGHGEDESVAIKLDPINGDVVVAGTRVTDPGNNDIHLMRYRSSDGFEVWGEGGKTLLRELSDDQATDMAVDGSGTLFVVGETGSGDAKDIIAVKFDWQGNIVGDYIRYGTPELKDGVYGVTVNSLGEAFVAGYSINAQANADYLVFKMAGDPVLSPYPFTAAAGYTDATLSWKDIATVDNGGYHINRKDGACSETNTNPETELPNQSAPTKSYVDAGLTQSRSYCYRIQHFNSSGSSRWVEQTVTTLTPLPPAPFTATAADTTKVTLAWTPLTTGQTGFDIEKCSASATEPLCENFSFLATASGAALTYDDSSSCLDTINRYRITAKGDGWASAPSAPVTVATPTFGNLIRESGFEGIDPTITWYSPVGGVLDGGIVTESVKTGTKSLKFTADGTRRVFGRKQPVVVTPGGVYQMTGSINASLTKGMVQCDFLGGGLDSSAISVAAGDVNNNKGWVTFTEKLTVPSSAVPPVAAYVRCFALESPVGTYPEGTAYLDDVTLKPLTEMTAVVVSDTRVDLAWSDSYTDETGFRVERCTDVGCTTAQLIGMAGANVATYSDVGLVPGTTYWYRVQPFKNASCNGGWSGDYSATVSVITTKVAPTLTAAKESTTRLNLSWTDVSADKTDYALVRCTGTGCDPVAAPDGGFPVSLGYTSLAWADSTVCKATTYRYQVQAAGKGLPQGGIGPWTKKVKLDFGTPVSTFRQNFLTRVSIAKLTGMASDFSDIRFYDETSHVALPYWIETKTDGASAKVWVKTGNNDNVYLYFGNASATTANDLAGVFGTGLVGYWPFNENVGTITGTTADVSGKGNAGTLTNMAAPSGIVAAGKYGNGLNLDGTNDYVRVADTTASSLDITGSITLETWYQYQPSAAWARIISKPTINGAQPWDLYHFYLDDIANSQRPTFRVVGSNTMPASEIGITGPNLVPGNWYHLVGRYNTATGKISLFVNGIEYSTTGTPFAIAVNDEPLAIGSMSNYGNYTKGVLDEVRLYNRALADKEIAARYAAQLPAVAAPAEAAVSTEPGGYSFAQWNWQGAWSSPPSATPTTIATDEATPPSALKVERVSEVELKLTWTDNTADETEFEIWRCKDTAGDTPCTNYGATPWKTVPFKAGTATAVTYNDTGLESAKTYRYKVRAHKFGNGVCEWWSGFDTAPQSSSATTSIVAPNTLGKTFAITTNCEDARFTAVNDDMTVSSLAYWIESGCNSPSTKFHVKVPKIAAGGKTVSFYYGNPFASAKSNGADTFMFFDDFDGTALDTGKWTVVDGTGYSVSNGALHMTNTTGRIRSVGTYTTGINVQAKVKAISFPGNGFVPLSLSAGWGSNVGFLNHPGTTQYYSNNALYVANPNASPSGAALTDDFIYSLIVKNSTTVNPQIYDLTTGATYWSPGDISNTNAARPIVFGRRTDDSYLGQGYSADWDWIRVRKYVEPTPGFGTVAPEEHSAAPYALPAAAGSGTWGFLRQIPVTYPTGATVTDYQLTTYIDTTPMARERVTLTWTDTTSSETGFLVERCSGTAATCVTGADPETDTDTFPRDRVFQMTGNNPGTTAIYVDRELRSNANYCYRVKAERTSAPTWRTAPTAVVCQAFPAQAAPTLNHQDFATEVKLSWDNSTIGENEYQLERCTGAACNFDPPDAGYAPKRLDPNTTTFTDSGVCTGTYKYRVRPVKYNDSGAELTAADGWPAFSNIAVAQTGTATPPVLVSVSRGSEIQLNVSWTDKTSDEDGFKVYRCTYPDDSTPCTDFAYLDTVSAATGTDTSVTYSDLKEVVPGRTYRYHVTAFKNAAICPSWETVPSAPISNDNAKATVTSPVLTAVTANTTQVNLNWTDGTASETGFKVQRCDDTNISNTAACTSFTVDSASLSPNSTLYADSAVCSTTKYTYRINDINHGVLSGDGGGLWTYQVPINISNFKQEFPVSLPVSFASGMKNDFSDIRFFDLYANTELPYWVESKTDNSSAKVWVRTGATNSVRMFYGNGSATSSSSMAKVFGDGLMGFWRFSENAGTVSGTISDLSGMGNHVTLNSFVAPNGIVASGWEGNGLSLDGTNDWANRATPNLPTGSVMTAEAWIYPKGYSTDPYNGVISWGGRSSANTLVLSIQPSGRPSMATWGNDFVPTTGPAATLNAWNHIAVVLNGTTTATLYLNGVAVSGAMSNNAVPNVISANLGIGATDYGSGTRFFNGLIDEVKVYNRALSAQELVAHYTALKPAATVDTNPANLIYQPAGFSTWTDSFSVYSNSAVAVTPNPANIVPDPDFEDATSKWTGYVTSTTNVSFDTAVSYSGKTSLKLAPTSGTGLGKSLIVPVIPGASYTLSCYLKSALTAGAVQCDVLGGTLDSSNTKLSGTSDWTYRSEVVTIPAGVTSVTVRAFADGNPRGSAWVDMVQLVPTAPITLTAYRVSEVQSDLEWNDIFTNETGFNLYRCEGTGCTNFGAPYKKLAAGTIYNFDTGLQPNRIYRYRVAAYKDATCGWESTQSNIVEISTAIDPPLLGASGVNATRIKLNITDPTVTRTGFNIFRCPGGSCTPTQEVYHNVSAAGRTIDEGLKARYLFNGTINDSSASALNLTSQYGYTPQYDDGGVRLSPGIYYLSSASTNVLDTDNHTIEFDLKFNSDPGSSYVKIFSFAPAGTDRSPAIWTNGGPYLHWRYANAASPNTGVDKLGYDKDYGSPFIIGRWYRIRGVKNGSSFKVYVDNRLVADTTVSNPKYSGSAPIKFGESYGTPNISVKNFSIYASTADPAQGTFYDDQACPDTTYTYKVQANSESGWGGGPMSLPASATALSFPAPTGFQAKAISDEQVNLSWSTTVPGDQSGFSVATCLDGTCTTSTYPNQGTAAISSLLPEKTYCFKVKATKNAYCSGGIESPYTPDQCVTTFSRRPKTLTATPLGPFKIKLEWADMSANEEGFVVETKIWNGKWVTRKIVDPNSGSGQVQFIDTQALEPSKTYTYQVRAFRGGEISPPTNEASATTMPFTGRDSTCP